jgi:tetratricopeptide (TPR) repeat protein
MSSPSTDIPERAKVLVSWKEIAAFLGRAERTVKRWERERGLPVHRVPGGERSGVFAYSHELSAWLLGEEGRAPETSSAVGDNQRNEETAAFALADSEAAPGSQQAIDSSKLAPQPVRAESNLRLWRAIAGVSVLALIPLTASFLAIRHYRASSHVKAVQLAPPGSRHASSPRAEQLYLQGRYQWSLRTAESLAKSVDAYTQAIVEDPAYAQAYAGLAESYDLLPQYAQVNSADAFQRAKAAASRAIELDPNLAAGHRAKAFVLFYGYWDVAGSDAEFKRALALAPNEAETHHWYGTTLFSRQEDVQSLAHMDEAVRLSPTTPAIVADSAFVHAVLRNNREANIKILREMSRTQPNLVKSSRYLVGIDLDDRNYAASLEDLRQVAEISHDPAANALAISASRGWARGGRSGLLEAIRKAAQAAFDQGCDSGYGLGDAYLRLGQPKKALPYFRAALERNDFVLMRLSARESVAALKDDPGYRLLFQQIRERMGLPKTPGVHIAMTAKPGSSEFSMQDPR